MEEPYHRVAMFGPGLDSKLAPEWYGNKAAGLAEMAADGIPVQPG